MLRFFPATLSGKQRIFFAVLAIVLVLLPLGHILINLAGNCTHLVDYGIYQQAIYQIAAGESWNPYVTVRDIFIFNEHFDPVIYLSIPFVWLTKYASWSLGVFEWLWYLAFTFLSWVLAKPKNIREMILVFAFVFFSRGILSGVLFTGHPVTWAIVPILLMVYFLSNEKYKGAWVCALLLCFFKETFGFGILGLSGAFILRKEWRRFLSFFILGGFFVLFELKLRSLLIGNTFSYGNMFLAKMFEDPIKFGSKLLVEFEYKSLFKIFFPFLVPTFVVMQKYRKKGWRSFLAGFEFKVLCFLAPMLLIHIIINRFYFHHASKFSALLIGVVIFNDVKREICQRRYLFYLTVLLSVVGGMSMITKIVKSNFSFGSAGCNVSREKLALRTKIKAITDQIGNTKKIYTTGGVGPYLLRPNIQMYQHVMSARLPEYNYIVLEKDPTSSTWPLAPEDVLRIQERCQPYATNVMMDNTSFFFAEGKFPNDCIFGGSK